MKTYPSQDRLKELFSYDPYTGFFTAFSAYKRRKAGAIIPKPNAIGYSRISVDGQIFLYHRLVYIWNYGYLSPDTHLDHINGNRNDNRICNLRTATYLENNHNQAIRSNNSSGAIGVHWSKSNKKWQARIRCNYKRIYLGSFDNKDDAVEAYLLAKKSLHPTQPIPRHLLPQVAGQGQLAAAGLRDEATIDCSGFHTAVLEDLASG